MRKHLCVYSIICLSFSIIRWVLPKESLKLFQTFFLSFQPINNADFVVPVEIDGAVHQVYVLKRPHVDEFLRRCGELYECVLFTASLAKYADPVADLLDRWVD